MRNQLVLSTNSRFVIFTLRCSSMMEESTGILQPQATDFPIHAGWFNLGGDDLLPAPSSPTMSGLYHRTTGNEVEGGWFGGDAILPAPIMSELDQGTTGNAVEGGWFGGDAILPAPLLTGIDKETTGGAMGIQPAGCDYAAKRGVTEMCLRSLSIAQILPFLHRYSLPTGGRKEMIIQNLLAHIDSLHNGYVIGSSE